jgi:hypothetical protein
VPLLGHYAALGADTGYLAGAWQLVLRGKTIYVGKGNLGLLVLFSHQRNLGFLVIVSSFNCTETRSVKTSAIR